MKPLIVVIAAYFLTYSLEYTTVNASEYYFLHALNNFALIAICAALRDKLCIIYAVIMLAGMPILAFAIFPTEDWAMWVLYSSPLNYSIIVFYAEIIMIGAGIKNGLRIFSNWRYNVHNSGGGTNKGNFEAKHSA